MGKDVNGQTLRDGVEVRRRYMTDGVRVNVFMDTIYINVHSH